MAFLITSGPCNGLTATATSDSAGQATFTYSCGSQGTDVISATATVSGVAKSATAQKTWCNPPVAVVARAGNRGFFRLSATASCFGPPNLFVSDSASALVAGPYPSGTVVLIATAPTPGVGPGRGGAAATIFVKGNATAYATDTIGRSSAGIICKPTL